MLHEHEASTNFAQFHDFIYEALDLQNPLQTDVLLVLNGALLNKWWGRAVVS